MSQPIDELVLKISADINGLQTAMAHVVSAAQEMASKTSGHAESMTSSFFKAEVAVDAVKFAFEKLKAITVDYISDSLTNIDAQTKLADRLGVTTQFIAGLKVAGEDAGLSLETMGTAMGRMERSLASIHTAGAPAADALRTLSLTLDDLKGKSPEQQLGIIADRFATLRDQGQRTTVATELFGREGIKLVGVLSQGSAGLADAEAKAKALGLSFDRVDGAKVEAANRAIREMKESLEGLSNTITIQLAPLITGIGEQFVEDAKQGDAFGQTVHDVIETLITMVDGFRAEFAAVKVVVEGIALVLNTSWAGSLTLLDALIRANIVFPFMLAKNAVGAIIETFKQLSGPEIGDIFRHIGAELLKFFTDTVVEISDLMHKLGETMVANGVKGGTELESVSDAIRRSVNGMSVAAQVNIQDTQASMDKLKDVWKDVIPTWESTAIPGLSALAAKLRSNVSLLYNDLVARLNTPFEPHAFAEWCSKVVTLANKAAADVAAKVQAMQSGAVGGGEDVGSEKRAKDAIAAMLATLNQKELQENESYARRIDALKEFFKRANTSQADQDALESQAKSDHEKRLAGIAKDSDESQAKFKQTTELGMMSATASIMGSMSELLERGGKEQFEIGKALAYGQAVVNTARAAMAAYADGVEAGGPYGPALGAAYAAAAIATGAVQIASISSQHWKGTGGGAAGGAVMPSAVAGGAAGGGSGVSGTRDGGQSINISLNGDNYSAQGVRNLIGAINDQIRDGAVIQNIAVN